MWSKLRLKQFFMIAVLRTYWPSSCSEGKGLWFWSDFLWPVPAGWGGAITRTPAHGDTTGPAHPLRLCVVTLQPKWAQPPPHQWLHHQTGTNTTLFSLNSTVGAVRFWLLLIWTSEVDSFAHVKAVFFFTWLYLTEPHLLLDYGSCGLAVGMTTIRSDFQKQTADAMCNTHLFSR